jgi:multidrug efflux pump subunit AcrB
MKQFKNIQAKYPGYTVNYGGENEDSAKSVGSLIRNFLIALVFIYFILVIFFRSLMTPLVVMSAVPFGIVGVYLALLIHQRPMTLMGFLGMFSVAGIIISNTLVLIQFISLLRDEGKPLKEALIEGGAVRIRPILLTSGVTALSLMPAIYGLGGKDAFVDPLSMAFGYGLIFATFITLIIVPCFYCIAEDAKQFVLNLFKK